ncbi:hypothetical protein KIN20_018515 [Parelaphostrongylus tenuis]|uniref:Granulins domain-containing protein n=1 Tax=Parelaphostrongylus tenuis TaxID=148309 RepID=A0AAD5N7L9_PARTN|nr:hypothetical protein KIN20_018515 [Parelaphostrongylus tenuis]
MIRLLCAVLCFTAMSSSDRADDGLKPNLCDAKGTVQCDNYQTCCLFADGRHGCCPFTVANCCPKTSSCCPAGFRCGEKGCLRMIIP